MVVRCEWKERCQPRRNEVKVEWLRFAFSKKIEVSFRAVCPEDRDVGLNDARNFYED